MQLLSKGSPTPASQAEKAWSLDFLLSPISFNSSDTAPKSLSSIAFVKNALQGPNVFDSSAKVLSTSSESIYATSLAFRSIGYKSEAINGMENLGIKFDDSRGIIPNDYHGRITSFSKDDETIPGMYCSGWVKRGPAGVIANTMEDAFDTAETIAKDWESKRPFMSGGQGWDVLKEEVERKGLRSVSWSDWQKIDVVERERGKEKGKEREKFASVHEMLGVLD